MPRHCPGDCLTCGQCAALPILGDFSPGRFNAEPRSGFGVAADIGTTGVVLALLDLSSGQITARHSFANPQRRFGPDVISRIDAANNGALEEMRRLILGAVTEGIEALLSANGILPSQIAGVTVAGNTTMTHLLLGLPCNALGAFPFKPEHRLEARYELFGFQARIVPWLTAFVGGDILAGLLCLPKNEPFLFIDLGTNGEMALQSGGKLTVASAAAGPAFEGGAGGGASGVIAELARLLRAGTVDPTGLLKEESVLTQAQVRGLQLAKSAVRTGCELLLEGAGLTYGGLNAVYLAGGIGQALDIDDAVCVGLLPGGAKEKTRAVGNASLGGAARLLLSPGQAAAELLSLRAAAEEVVLAAQPRFNDLFVEHMSFTAGG